MITHLLDVSILVYFSIFGSILGLLRIYRSVPLQISFLEDIYLIVPERNFHSKSIYLLKVENTCNQIVYTNGSSKNTVSLRVLDLPILV